MIENQKIKYTVGRVCDFPANSDIVLNERWSETDLYAKAAALTLGILSPVFLEEIKFFKAADYGLCDNSRELCICRTIEEEASKPTLTDHMFFWYHYGETSLSERTVSSLRRYIPHIYPTHQVMLVGTNKCIAFKTNHLPERLTDHMEIINFTAQQLKMCAAMVRYDRTNNAVLGFEFSSEVDEEDRNDFISGFIESFNVAKIS